MNPDTITWIWFGAGAVLMLAEFVLPGLVVVFLGLGAMLVALGRWLHLLEGEISSFTTWFIISLVLVISLRQLLARFVPAETSYQSPEEDLNAYGTVVEVLEAVDDRNSDGRIRFQGSSWPATCPEGSIASGNKARLLYRDNVVWVVESADDSDSLLEPWPPSGHRGT
jgi:membrane protein implicated in regulation of membrane protease activity